MQKGQGAAASVRAYSASDFEVQSVLNAYHSLRLRKSFAWYPARLNRSSVEKVMAILRTLRSTVKADGNLGGNSLKKKNYYIVKPNLSYFLKATKLSKINIFPTYKYL